MSRHFGLILSLFLAAHLPSNLRAADLLRGHWSGSMAVPDQPVSFEVDLDNPNGAWVGSISIPSRHASGIELDNISSSKGTCVFRIKGAAELPTFKGAISADGKSMSGEFIAGRSPIPFKLTRDGEPKVELPKANPPVPAQFTGEWEGGIETAVRLRLSLRITNGPGGAVATLKSLEESGGEIPVSTLRVIDNRLNVEVAALGAALTGTLDADGKTLNGAWLQAGKSLAVILKKK